MTRPDHLDLWFKDAVIYQIPMKSFYDSTGDGFGDIRGVIEKLDYVRDLGVDCLWFCQSTRLPGRDDGYDISDFTFIDPNYGTVDDSAELLTQAHMRGIRVVAGSY